MKLATATNVIPKSVQEGVLRSSFLPEDIRGGTRVFLSFERGWFVVHTRFETFARRRNLNEATSLFEKAEMGTLPN